MREDKTIVPISAEYKVHPTQLNKWMRSLQYACDYRPIGASNTNGYVSHLFEAASDDVLLTFAVWITVLLSADLHKLRVGMGSGWVLPFTTACGIACMDRA